MADNTLLNVNTSATGATNVIVAADEIGGVLVQRVKPVFGDDGFGTDVSTTNPMPTAQTGALPAGANLIGNVGITGAIALSTGSNVIGKVGVQIGGADATGGAGAVGASTQRTTLASDDPAVAALQTIRDATATINVAPDTTMMKEGATSLTPKFAVISAAVSGNNTLVAAVASKKIRVLAYNFITAGAVNAKFQSGASGTDLTGLKTIDAASKGLCAPFNPVGWFQTGTNTLLNLNLSGAVLVGGEMTYIEVT